MIRAVIFDFDGLIIDTETPIYRSWLELYESYGGSLAFSTWAQVVGTVSNEWDHFEGLEVQIGFKLDHTGLSPKRRQRELELIYSQPLQPGIQDYLRDAREIGLKIGMASSSPCRWVTGHLERLGIIEFFDYILARDDVKHVKPDPELYQRVLDFLHIEPEDALVFEDSPIGVEAAVQAGIFCVAVPNQFTRQLSLDHADLYLESLADLSLRELIHKVEHMKNGASRA